MPQNKGGLFWSKYDYLAIRKALTSMYFTSLPDSSAPGFDEELHYRKFRQHNIIFNAVASKSYCDDHVGCLSFKTVLSGEEWYGVNNVQKAVRPGQFLILNDDQTYSSRIDTEENVRSFAVFFQKEFASSVFRDALLGEEVLLDNPFEAGSDTPAFFQTLYTIDSTLQHQLTSFISQLETDGYDANAVNEDLTFLLQHLMQAHKSEVKRSGKVNAIKPGTKTEIYKRLCIAKDVLHSSFMDKTDLSALSNAACLSMPQLVRQFKAVFKTTPHQYLTTIRLAHAAMLLKKTSMPVHEITWACGFENTSAFCRIFKTAYSTSPLSYRALN